MGLPDTQGPGVQVQVCRGYAEHNKGGGKRLGLDTWTQEGVSIAFRVRNSYFSHIMKDEARSKIMNNVLLV